MRATARRCAADGHVLRLLGGGSRVVPAGRALVLDGAMGTELARIGATQMGVNG